MVKISMTIKILFLFLIAIIHAWLFRGFFIDDAFITFRVVRQWTHGNGLVYNIGERVEGYSNFWWIILLTPFDLTDINLILASKFLGIILGLLTLLVTYAFAKRLPLPEIAPFLLVVSGPFVAWMMGGLETLLFTFLLTLSGYIFIREEETDKGGLSGILFGLLALTRPEGLLFALVAGILRLWRLFQERSLPSTLDLFRIAGGISLVVPYYLWRFTYYGYLLPNTVYAKSGGLHPRPLLEGFYYIHQSLDMIGGFFVLAFPLALLIIHSQHALYIKYLTSSITAYFIFFLISGGDWMPMQRFLVHILPFIYLLVHAGVMQLQVIRPSPWVPALIAILILGQAAYLLVTSLEHRFIAGIGNGSLIPKDTPTVIYLQQHIEADHTIAVVDAGIYAYIVPLETRVVDMIGLTDAHIAHRPIQYPNGLLGQGDAFGKWDVDYILAQSPDFVQVYLRGQTPSGQWKTHFTGTTLLINDPRFQAAYELVSLEKFGGLFAKKVK